MEEIANLIEEAKNSIDEFEKYMFSNHIEKYIAIKECSAYMKARVGKVESMARIDALDEEAQASLEQIISKSKEFIEAFKNGKNVTITVDDDGEFVAREVAEEEALTKFNDFKPIETSAVKIIDYEPENKAQETELTVPAIIDVPGTEEALVTPSSEMPVIKDDTATTGANFTEALDVQALDAFLSETNNQQNSATAALRL